ncbi:MAG: hybrid sensor histidine kinase/response regulator [Raineya sp.]|jgi:two-component system sensor histidine kinase/response regulator|nr:hybrid sensor histidine kinase/response regulator [Raineya sp.]
MLILKNKPTLLIADDQPDNLRAIIDILQKSSLQFEFINVPNGKVLVDIAIKKQPDLIITDWEMPEMNGLEAISALKQHPQTQDIPVIICTGIMITPNDLKVALEAGAADYIKKPIEPIELLARVQSMLTLSASYRKIKEQKEELETLNILKNRLLSVVSHDTRSPLNSLKGTLFLLENDALTQEEMKDTVGKIIIQSEQVNNFLDNLLHWAKSQFEQLKPNISTLNLQEILHTTIELLKPIALAKKITISYQDIQDVIVEADKEMLKTVIRNLISNAIKFCSANDTIEIKTLTSNNQVTIFCNDTGIGISQENLEKIFGKGQLSTQGTNNELGTGLGLLLCKSFVEANGGNIGVTSQENKGSSFWFTVPLSKN